METFSEEFEAVAAAIDIAWVRYPNGDNFETKRLKQELDEIFAHYGGHAEENTFEWHFHTADKRSYLSDKLRKANACSPQKPLYSENRASPTPAQLIGRLSSIVRAKRPLSSKFCKGIAKTYLNQALRVYESAWLKQKGVGPVDPIASLRCRRLKPNEHDKIRALVSDRLIPALSQQRSNDNAALLWKQSLVLELADLFARYTPPTDCEALGIAALPAGAETLFIKFLSAALAYFDPDIAPNNEAVAAFWLNQKRTMLGSKNQKAYSTP